jgi:hypothetical protein
MANKLTTGQKRAQSRKRKTAAQKAIKKKAQAGRFEFDNSGSPLDGRFRLESPVGHPAGIFDDFPIQPGSIVGDPHIVLADSVRLIISTTAGDRLVFEHYYPNYITLFRISLTDNNAKVEAELAI